MSKSFSRGAAVALLSVASVAASAGEAEICYSASVPLGTVAPPTNATVFQCPVVGNRTLPELAQLGWTVVQLVPIQTGANSQAQQLVIQKP